MRTIYISEMKTTIFYPRNFSCFLLANSSIANVKIYGICQLLLYKLLRLKINLNTFYTESKNNLSEIWN